MPNPLADEARTLSDEELAEAINEAYREQFNLQFQRGTRQLQNPMALKTARRQIARLRTILRERQQAVAAGTPIEPLSAAPVVAVSPQRQAAHVELEEAVEAIDEVDELDAAVDAIEEVDELDEEVEATEDLGEAAGEDDDAGMELAEIAEEPDAAVTGKDD